MRDGVRLSADVYRPRRPDRGMVSPLPVILIRMPYGKAEAYCALPREGRFFAKCGYVCVVQDVRGRFASDGEFDPFVNEGRDGWDTLDWIAAQPWCDGNIGMTGESYFGYTQWAVAVLGHPGLECISPGDTSADVYGTWVYNHGAFCLQTAGGGRTPSLEERMRTPAASSRVTCRSRISRPPRARPVARSRSGSRTRSGTRTGRVSISPTARRLTRSAPCPFKTPFASAVPRLW